LPFLLKAIGLIIAYLVAAKIGMEFGTVNGSATIFWPPGGIALAALLLGGVRYLPAIFIGAYLAAVMVHAPLIFALGSSIGNTLETYIGYSLLTRFAKTDLALNHIKDLFLIILLGALIPAIASAALGPLTLFQSGLISSDLLPSIIWRWWRSDVLGIVFFTPMILIWAKRNTSFFNAARAREFTALWITSFIVGESVFFGWQLPGILSSQPVGLAWIFPPLFWASLRTGRRNTSLIQLLFVSQALLSAYLHIGLFADDFVRYGLANFWMFAMLLAVMGMSLAILSTAQRAAVNHIALNAKVFSVSNDGILITDAQSNIVEINPAFTKLTGYTSDEVIGKNPRLLASGKQAQGFYAGMWRTLIEQGYWEGEIWNRRKNGEAFLEKLRIHTIKDFHGRVVNHIGIFTDITLIKMEQETITHQAQHDYLTGLPNRLLFRDRFNQQLALAKRHELKFAVIFLDLDQFKPVNDRYGHFVGDLLLAAVAERLTALVREIDTVSRLGGDEFAILFSEVADQQSVIALADKILNSLEQPFTLENRTIQVSASLGIAMYPEDGSDLDTMMNKADKAMYQAKRSGANSDYRQPPEQH